MLKKEVTLAGSKDISVTITEPLTGKKEATLPVKVGCNLCMYVVVLVVIHMLQRTICMQLWQSSLQNMRSHASMLAVPKICQMLMLPCSQTLHDMCCLSAIHDWYGVCTAWE